MRIGLRPSPPRPFVPGRPHWWQWPTVLALDAPAVALAWQALFARTAGIRLGRHHAVLLGLSVWLAYAADRWIEAWRLDLATVNTQRHYFFLRWRWPTFAVWVAALAAGLGIAWERLSAPEWVASLGMLAPVLLYLLSHQLLHRDHPWRVPKEICVAVILAGGAALYPAALAPSRAAQLAPAAALFALLALANCLLISGWEREVDQNHRQTSLALSFPRAHSLTRWLPWALVALGAATAALPGRALCPASACTAASGAFLALLDHWEPHLGRERARVLADVALLTPLAALLFLPTLLPLAR